MRGEHIKGYNMKRSLTEKWLALFEIGWPMSALALQTAAQYFWLDVIPPRDERYDRIMQTDSLITHPMASKFPDAAMPQPFRRAREAFGGII